MIRKKILTWLIPLVILTGCGGDTTPSNENGNKSPVVNAGNDVSTIVNQPITIVGTVTDDGSISSYEWKRGEDTLGTEISVTYTPTEVRVDTLTLIATDDDGKSGRDEVEVRVKEKNTIDLPSVSKLMYKIADSELIKNSVHNLSFAYYQDKGSQRWYISPVNFNNKVDVYSLMVFKNGRNGWGTVAKDVASFNLNNEMVSIDNIEDNDNYTYYDRGWGEYNTDPIIQSDIEKIRNSTVSIKWWFFQVSNGSWYIINKNGDAYKFSSKTKNGILDYNWIKIDMGGAKPNFFIKDGVKKIKFTSSDLSTISNPSEPNWDSGFYHHEKDSNGQLINNLWYRGFAPKRFYDYTKGEFSELPKCQSTGIEALGNCTWYAKARARELGGAVSYSSWGNAKSFDENARNQGYTVDKNPVVGDIAQHNVGKFGHVAVVEKVNNDETIVISESSYAPCIPSWNFLHRIRTVKISVFENYIHVK